MNILIINHYAGSPEFGMEYRPYYMAQEWIKMGHKVMIVAASQAHVRSKQFELQESFSKMDVDGIEYIILKTPTYQGNGFSRVKNLFSFVIGLYAFKNFLGNFNPDIVIASSTYPLDIFPAKKIARFFKVKLIFEVHDLWPLSPMELGNISKFHPFMMLLQFAENYAYKHSDKVVSMLPKTQEHMKNHGLDLKKWYYIPNGILSSEWENSIEIDSNIRNLLNEFIKKDDFVIAYTGSLGLANSLNTFILAAELLKSHSNIKFVVVGKGPEKENLLQMCNENKLSNVLFIDAVNKKTIPNLLKNFDVLYIGLKKQNLFKFGISPNKLMDYMMSSKPIIQAIEAGNDMVSEAKCGISVNAENPKEVSEAILSLKSMSQSERIILGENGRKFILENHTYEQLARNFEAIMKYKNND